jgi:hypothetical protein
MHFSSLPCMVHALPMSLAREPIKYFEQCNYFHSSKGKEVKSFMCLSSMPWMCGCIVLCIVNQTEVSGQLHTLTTLDPEKEFLHTIASRFIDWAISAHTFIATSIKKIDRSQLQDNNICRNCSNFTTFLKIIFKW